MNIFTVLLTQPLANGVIIFYKLFGSNMGLAILGFTVFLSFALNPLTKPYLESMQKMKKYQKDLAKLKAKHKDKQKYMKAQADFYKAKGINPSKGCIPYLLQIAVLIAFFRLFINIFDGGAVSATENINALLYEPLKLGAGEVLNTRFLYLDIAKPDTFMLSGISFALPGPLLILAALTQFMSAKITQPFIEAEKKLAKKTPEKSDDIMAQSQSYMIYMFPVFTLWFGSRFPSGLALYWLVFSINQAVRQYKASGWGGATPIINKIKSYS